MCEEGAVPAPEREYPLIVVDAGPIRGELQAAATRWVENFEPLEFEAARRAKLWLDSNLAAEVLPLTTYFIFSDEDEDELFGFFVLDKIEVKVAPFDLPIMQMRKAIEDPNAARQSATKLVWIARSKASPSGLGQEMFDYALHLAEEDGCCALMVDAFDQGTAEELWMKRYDLRKPRAGAAEWTCLWHAVGQANQDFN
jgi:hypothetical protein